KPLAATPPSLSAISGLSAASLANPLSEIRNRLSLPSRGRAGVKVVPLHLVHPHPALSLEGSGASHCLLPTTHRSSLIASRSLLLRHRNHQRKLDAGTLLEHLRVRG